MHDARIIIMREFRLRRFLFSTYLCSALNTTMISCMIIPYSKHLGMLPLQISIIAVSKRIVRIAGDGLMGLIFDRFGAKTLFIIGRLIKLARYIVLLYSKTFIWLCIAMIIHGLSEGTIQGKVSSFVYNNLRANGKISFFPRAMSIYYFVINGYIGLINFVASALLNMYDYDILIKVSIAINIVSIYLLVSLIPNNSQNNLDQFISKSFKEILKTTSVVVKNNNIVLYIIAIYGILVFFAWQFGSVASMILLDMGMTASDIALIASVVRMCTVVGSIISIYFFKSALSVDKIVICILALVAFGTVSAVVYDTYTFCAFMMLINLCYVFLEVSLEKNLEQFSNKTVRGTVISFAMICGNLVAVVANLVVGFIAKYASYRASIISILVVIFILIFCLLSNLKLELSRIDKKYIR